MNVAGIHRPTIPNASGRRFVHSAPVAPPDGPRFAVPEARPGTANAAQLLVTAAVQFRRTWSRMPGRWTFSTTASPSRVTPR